MRILIPGSEGNYTGMHITVDMVFSKEYIRRFAFSLSESDQELRFRKRDKLNSIIRSYLEISYDYFKPPGGHNVTRIIVPVNARLRCNPEMEILPQSSYRDLEGDFEDLFFTLFFKIDSAGFLNQGYRKEAREKYLAACGISSDVLTEDAFRKLFDRFRKKKTSEILRFLNSPSFDLLTFYQSGGKKVYTQPS